MSRLKAFRFFRLPIALEYKDIIDDMCVACEGS